MLLPIILCYFLVDLIAIFLADDYPINMWWMFLPHWSLLKILLILFVLADVIANVFLADLIAIYPVAGFIPLVF